MEPKPIIESIPYLSGPQLAVDTLRLDQIHPIVSGNKWYKLRYYLEAATNASAEYIASFGGAYSNHLVALAYVAKTIGLKSIGYVRSNQVEALTPSLQDALNYGMELRYLGRSSFQEQKDAIILESTRTKNTSIYFVDEGGYGHIGAKGASTILSDWDFDNNNPALFYDYIICAVGTGTMMAGIINKAGSHQTIIGIPVLKNEGSIQAEITQLLINKTAQFTLLYQFHQGGYAKTTREQINFMNQFWNTTKIPTDIVYTGKVFFAVDQLIQQNFFKPNSSVLVIHSGGLQGNRSLAKGVLNF